MGEDCRNGGHTAHRNCARQGSWSHVPGSMPDRLGHKYATPMARLRTYGCLVAATVAGLSATASSARADGDPASDVLLYQRVFIPDEAPVPLAVAARLFGVVNVAANDGYRIRVALIGSPRDMGSVSALWGKPQIYARFLGAELRFAYRGRLLVVMPNGFGISHSGRQVGEERARLRDVEVRQGANDLVGSATAAVTELARTSGAPLDPEDVARATSRALKALQRRQPTKAQASTSSPGAPKRDSLPAWVIFGVLAFGLGVLGAGLWNVFHDLRGTH